MASDLLALPTVVLWKHVYLHGVLLLSKLGCMRLASRVHDVVIFRFVSF
jgi:hypothetical protein